MSESPAAEGGDLKFSDMFFSLLIIIYKKRLSYMYSHLGHCFLIKIINFFKYVFFAILLDSALKLWT